MSLPGVTPEDCPAEIIHQIQINIAVLTHLPYLTFLRPSSHDPTDTSRIQLPVTTGDVIKKLEPYGVKLVPDNIVFPEYLRNEIRSVGEHRCRLIFQPVRHYLWLKILVDTVDTVDSG